MPAAVTRHFATVDGRFGRRHVHYRRAGQGPALLLLHQSPQSSRELVPLLEAWGERFTAFAPDTPGYGCSDPLGIPVASLDDFAAATVEFLDAVGVRRAGVYGFHTGGMIGVALGHRHPDRIAAVACNGLAVLDADERERILADYLPPIVPRWDGSHLVWAWARNRQQAVFFPWHWPARARRMDFPMPSPEYQQQALLELLRAGDTYHIAYRAAFVYDGPAALRALSVPAVITAAPSDPLSAHLPRIGAVAPAVSVEPSADADAALLRLGDHLAAHPGEIPPRVSPPSGDPADGDLQRLIVPTPVGSVHVRWTGPAAATPLLLVHAPGGSGASFSDALPALRAQGPVLAIDLPGHGESDPLVHPALGRIASAVAAVLAVLDTLGVERVRLLGCDWGAALAVALATTAPGRVAGVWLIGRPRPDAAGLAALRASLVPETVDWHGGHVLRYWHTVRDGRLYSPWFQRDRAHIRWDEPDLDEGRVHRDAVELMKAAGHWQELLGELAQRTGDADVRALAARGIVVREALAGTDPVAFIAGATA